MTPSLLALWLAISLALAQDPGGPGEGLSEKPRPEGKAIGDLRWIGSHLTDFRIDADGSTLDQSLWLDQRIRLGYGMQYARWGWDVELDALTGQVAGDTWSVEGAVDDRRRDVRGAFSTGILVPRRLSGTTRLGRSEIEAGLIASHWGLGMVANDGAHDPLFGRTDLADRVIRLRSTTLANDPTANPGALYLTIAGDLVVADDVASLVDDQQALQAIFSVLWASHEGSRLGTYTVVRHQWEATPGRRTQAVVVDGYADAPFELGETGWTLRAAAEGALIVGRTSRSTTYSSRKHVSVASFGATGLLVLASPQDTLKVHLRGGYASGDGDPDDGATHDFTFDRNLAAGMVLFDQVMGGIEARTHTLLSDPSLAGQPPDGIDALVTEGAFRRASFVQPAVEVAPARWLGLRGGAVLSFATAPVAHPFYTYRAGGTPHNHHDLPSEGRLLGSEVNWAIRFGPLPDLAFRPTFEVQGGTLVLGPPLRGAGPESVHHVMGIARIQW